MKLEYQGENGTRRIYRSDDGRLTVEITPTDYDRSKNSLMTQWVKRGWMPRFIERTLNVSTYLKTDEGECGDYFNPQVGLAPQGIEIVFEWMLEDTPDNERRILDEIERRYDAAGGFWQAEDEERDRLVAVCFPQDELERSRGMGEKMFVQVEDDVRSRMASGASKWEVFEGVLYNDSLYNPKLKRGAPVRFMTRGAVEPISLAE